MMTEQRPEIAQLQMTGRERLRAGEYPESVARDLSKQGLPEPELASLFREAASQARRSGLIRVVAGAVLLLAAAFIVMAARDAGLVIYGSGLLIGLFVLANGFLKIKNSGEIARAIKPPNQ